MELSGRPYKAARCMGQARGGQVLFKAEETEAGPRPPRAREM